MDSTSLLFYCKLQSRVAEFFIDQLDFTLGRFSCGEVFRRDHSVALQHAKISYSKSKQAWEFRCLGQHVAYVGAQTVEGGKSVTLSSQLPFQLGSTCVYFLLPKPARLIAPRLPLQRRRSKSPSASRTTKKLVTLKGKRRHSSGSKHIKRKLRIKSPAKVKVASSRRTKSKKSLSTQLPTKRKRKSSSKSETSLHKGPKRKKRKHSISSSSSSAAATSKPAAKSTARDKASVKKKRAQPPAKKKSKTNTAKAENSKEFQKERSDDKETSKKEKGDDTKEEYSVNNDNVSQSGALEEDRKLAQHSSPSTVAQDARGAMSTQTDNQVEARQTVITHPKSPTDDNPLVTDLSKEAEATETTMDG